MSLDEAIKCFRAGAYTACAVMCGRALEGICVHHSTKAKNLDGGLKELLKLELIDQRLYKWGDALRQLRNIGAHASENRIGRDDAKDVLDFLHAIVEYIFVLSERFRTFMERKTEAEKKEAAPKFNLQIEE